MENVFDVNRFYPKVVERPQRLAHLLGARVQVGPLLAQRGDEPLDVQGRRGRAQRAHGLEERRRDHRDKREARWIR